MLCPHGNGVACGQCSEEAAGWKKQHDRVSNEFFQYRLRVARALGMYYTPEGHGDFPCSDDEAVNAITEMVRQVQRQAECWHCGDMVMPYPPVAHCQDCPPFGGCDVEECQHCKGKKYD